MAADGGLQQYAIHDGIYVVPRMDTMLGFDANALLADLATYPVRREGDAIAWGAPQWVHGTHKALNYRGHALKRMKMWFQLDGPRENGFVKYYYTGWQHAVLPATAPAERCPELQPIWHAYNRSFAPTHGFMGANHAIVTRYEDGDHNIGAHSDKAKSIAPSTAEATSAITVVKLGPSARRFTIEHLDGTLLLDRVLPPGTGVIMSLEANLQTKHAVPRVPHCGPSGSIVFRTITERVSWERHARKMGKYCDCCGKEYDDEGGVEDPCLCWCDKCHQRASVCRYACLYYQQQ